MRIQVTTAFDVFLIQPPPKKQYFNRMRGHQLFHDEPTKTWEERQEELKQIAAARSISSLPSRPLSQPEIIHFLSTSCIEELFKRTLISLEPSASGGEDEEDSDRTGCEGKYGEKVYQVLFLDMLVGEGEDEMDLMKRRRW